MPLRPKSAANEPVALFSEVAKRKVPTLGRLVEALVLTCMRRGWDVTYNGMGHLLSIDISPVDCTYEDLPATAAQIRNVVQFALRHGSAVGIWVKWR